MGGKPRIEYYGAIYYVIQKEDKVESIFKTEEEKIQLLELLSEAKEIFDFKIFSYVIMDNGYEFLIQTLNIPISKIIHRINTKYAMFYNRSRKRRGPVFKNRYRAILVQDETYLLTLIKHIHKKPVDAKLCNKMDEYNWSSDMFYRVNMENMVDIYELLDRISLNRIEAIKTYIDLMDEDTIENNVLKESFINEDIIGSDEFKVFSKGVDYKPVDLDSLLEKACPRLEEFQYIKNACRKRYLTEYKRKYIELGRQEGYTYREIGENINVTAGSVRNIMTVKKLNK